jgi:CubicO group peptidase (beta-lactamase class C family)
VIGAIVAVFAFLSTPAIDRAGAEVPLTEQLEAYGRTAQQLGFWGTVLVARDKEILIHKGYGWADLARSLPNHTDTWYPMASLSKQFIAAAVLRLEADGKLHTSDPISRFLDNVPPDKARTTIHQLLTHDSGLGRFGWNALISDWQPMSRAQAVQGILSSRLERVPVSGFSYQNANYVLLAAIVEAAGGVPIRTFLRDRLFEPAGISRVQFDDFQVSPGSVASHPVPVGHCDGRPVCSALARPRSWLRVGSVLMRVEDLFCWMLALRDDRVLPAGERRKLFSMQKQIEPGFGYAYGWWVRANASGRPVVIFHGGDFRGYHAEARWYPDTNTTLIVATNNEFHEASLAETVLNHLVGILRGKSSPLPSLKPLAEDQLLRYVGSYAFPSGAELEVSVGRGHLSIQAQEPVGADVLTDADPRTAPERRACGQRTLQLIDRLHRSDLAVFGDVIAPELQGQVGDFQNEWKAIRAKQGRLKSYQLLANVNPPGKSDVVSYVRLNFVGRTMAMGFRWRGARLVETIPDARVEPGPVVFAAIAEDEFVAFDWRFERLLRASFSPRAPEPATAVSLHGRSRAPTATRRSAVFD